MGSRVADATRAVASMGFLYVAILAESKILFIISCFTLCFTCGFALLERSDDESWHTVGLFSEHTVHRWPFSLYGIGLR